jgi:hypothetical protein
MAVDVAERSFLFALRGLPFGFGAAECEPSRLGRGVGRAPRCRFARAPQVDDLCHVLGRLQGSFDPD